jgi:hypothetical protein
MVYTGMMNSPVVSKADTITSASFRVSVQSLDYHENINDPIKDWRKNHLMQFIS